MPLAAKESAITGSAISSSPHNEQAAMIAIVTVLLKRKPTIVLLRTHQIRETSERAGDLCLVPDTNLAGAKFLA